MNLSRGALVFIFDPQRNSGSQTGFRGLAVVVAVDERVTVRAVDPPNATFSVHKSAVQAVYAAAHVAPPEEFFK